MTEASETPAPVRVRRRIIRRPKSGLGWFMLLVTLLVLLVAGVGLVTRYGVLTNPGRLFIEARSSGLKLGRIGKLKIEGLQGDIWKNFTVRRLTISDEGGVWLEAADLAVVWHSGELFQRRFHADKVTARQVRVLRRPTLTPKTKSSALPVSFDIDSLRAQVEMLPEFSTRRGLFDLAGDFDVERNGGASGKLNASSLMHAGDGLKADFQVGAGKVVRVNADVLESQGGALAGALGLAVDQPFTLTARAGGTMAQGKFNLATQSGPIVPLSGDGAWNAAGGYANAQVLLSSSTLTTAYVKRFGPQARLVLRGEKNQKSLYDLDIDARAENLVVKARGPVDLTKKVMAGIVLDVSVADMTRLVSFPHMGKGHFAGRLSGPTNAWTSKGQLSAEGLTLGGYTLASATGPTEIAWRNRTLNITTDLAGSGGTGSGLFAAWMGATPRASATISRLPDRRFLIKALTGEGSGFTLKATGTRGILGGLSFDGDIRLSNLAAVRKGATGAMVGKWSASQGKGGDPWNLTVNGRGETFASGIGELDRLLGPSPRLKAEGAYDKGQMSFAKLSVDGDKADIAGAGVYTQADNGLKFQLDWRAKGPFHAGPVEVAGDVKGDGALTGTLGAPKVDLRAELGSIDFPRLTIKPAQLALSFARSPSGGDGTIKLSGSSDYGDAAGRADFRYAEDGLDLSGIDAHAGGVTASGSLALRGNQPSKADLTLAVGPGAFLAAGKASARVKIVDGRDGAQASMTLAIDGAKFKDSEVVIHSITASADGPLARLPYKVSADLDLPQAPIKLAGGGIATEKGEAWTVSFEGAGKVRGSDVKTLTPLQVDFGGPETTASGALAVGGGRMDIQAKQTSETVSLDARLQGVQLSALAEDLAGKVSGALAISGRGGKLTGSLDANLTGARSRDGPVELAIDGTVHGKLDGTVITLDASATNTRGLKSTASVTLPAESSAAPLRIAINRTRPIQGRFDVDGELQPVWDLFFGGARSLGGRLTAQGTLAGTINEPRVVGQANLANGRFEDQATGLKLTGVTVSAEVHEDRVVFRQFNAADGRGGTVSGTGQVSLERGGSSTFTLNANRFLLLDNDLAEAQASGAVTVTRGADGKAKLAGALTIDRADIVAKTPVPSGVVAMEVVERNRPAGREPAFKPAEARGPEIALDVKLTAPRRVFVKGKGLDVELSLDAHVGGSTARPQLEGVARVFRGDYQFASKRFEFDDRGVVYLANSADRIRLDLSATREDPSLTAVVKIAGTAAKPEITLTSTPVLPSDEVLSQVLFGRSAAQLSPVEGAQLASALSGLATGGGLDVIGNLRSFAGLDRLAFAGGDTSGLAVSGGKYITDDVYLELTGGGREGPSAQVEWRVRKTLSIVSKLAGTGDSKLSVRWRRDYGKAPGAK
ncbi:translocation/assembly module TamB domain-containing protein [soil metagenome]